MTAAGSPVQHVDHRHLVLGQAAHRGERVELRKRRRPAAGRADAGRLAKSNALMRLFACASGAVSGASRQFCSMNFRALV